MDYEIKDGELYIEATPTHMSLRFMAQSYLLLLRAQGITLAEAIQRAHISKFTNEVSTMERTMRAAIDELLASGWTPADSGSLD
jgi:hypothetical protein